jgi:3D (Asp-Asp-Asp) domain-containing protein
MKRNNVYKLMIIMFLVFLLVIGYLCIKATLYQQALSGAHGLVEEQAPKDCVAVLGKTYTAPADDYKSLGVFKVTYYWTGEDGVGTITKTGTTATAGRTIAVDPSVIPLGSEVMVGDRVYIAEDIGGAVKGKVIDIYVETPQGKHTYGVDFMEVKIGQKTDLGNLKKG